MNHSNAEPAVAPSSHPLPFIVQRNPGTPRNNRVARLNSRRDTGRRYEVLERESCQWYLVTVLTVIDGGRSR